jgi:hypothetical protein
VVTVASPWMQAMFRTLFLNLFGGPVLLPVVIAYLIVVLVGVAAAVRALLGTTRADRRSHQDPSLRA